MTAPKWMQEPLSALRIQKYWVIAFFFLFVARPAWADDISKIQEERKEKPKKIAVSTQGTYITGDFGSNKNTGITLLSNSVKYLGKKGEISLEVPYLFRNGGGIPPELSDFTDGASSPVRADGVGDIGLKGRYYMVDEKKFFPAVDLTADIKFPTASNDRGLGSGEFDYGQGFSFLKRFGKKVVALADTAISFHGRPDGSTSNRVRFDYSVGGGYLFNKQWSGYFFTEGATKAGPKEQAPLELIFAGIWKPRSWFSLNSFILVGLTDGSPDMGYSGGLTIYL